MFDLRYDEMLDFLRPFYGHCDVEDYGAITIEEHLINDIDYLSFISDSALNANCKVFLVNRVSVIQVDDRLNVKSKSFERFTLNTLNKVNSKPRVYNSFHFLVHKFEPFCLKKSSVLKQLHNAQHINHVPKDAGFDAYCNFSALYRHQASISISF